MKAMVVKLWANMLSSPFVPEATVITATINVAFGNRSDIGNLIAAE